MTLNGVGDVQTSFDSVANTGFDVATFLTDEIVIGIPNWMLIGGTFFLLTMSGNSGKRRR